MNRLLLAFALSISLTSPVFAEGSAQDVACSAFMAMGHDDQMAAMTAAMSSDAMAAEGAMATDGTAKVDDAMQAASGAMSADDQMAAMVKACKAHPDTTMMDAMHMMN